MTSSELYEVSFANSPNITSFLNSWWTPALSQWFSHRLTVQKLAFSGSTKSPTRRTWDIPADVLPNLRILSIDIGLATGSSPLLELYPVEKLALLSSAPERSWGNAYPIAREWEPIYHIARALRRSINRAGVQLQELTLDGPGQHFPDLLVSLIHIRCLEKLRRLTFVLTDWKNPRFSTPYLVTPLGVPLLNIIGFGDSDPRSSDVIIWPELHRITFESPPGIAGMSDAQKRDLYAFREVVLERRETLLQACPDLELIEVPREWSLTPEDLRNFVQQL